MCMFKPDYAGKNSTLMFMSMPAARRLRVLIDGLACPVSMRLMSHWAMPVFWLSCTCVKPFDFLALISVR